MTKVLIIDDEPSNRRLARRALEPLGFQIEEAADGVEGLEAVRRDRPDLILLDVRMPRMNGYEVCRALKDDEATRLIPIIILTSLDEITDKLEAIEAGAADFLVKPFDVAELTTRVKALVSLKHFTDELENAGSVLQGIARVVAERDAYTAGHCQRVGAIASRLGEMFHCSDEDLRALRLGAIFHDVGKIAVPDAVLRKPATLDPHEREKIKLHATVGPELVRPMKTMAAVVPLIRHHHEKLDGSGYPDGLKGDEIPLTVRILSVADIFDALATKRPYKDPLPVEECIRILRDEVKRGWWDPAVVDAMEKIAHDMKGPGRVAAAAENGLGRPTTIERILNGAGNGNGNGHAHHHPHPGHEEEHR
ncbi:MAG: response regulator [Elusimicrobia bacterium]|nr:response regulator [Elusimicrobiota bacterium]